jgi:hypothetical protein
MAMIQIRSRELTGTSYKGSCDLRSDIVGDWRVVLTNIDTSTAIPWSWSGVDQLVLRVGVTKYYVNFGTRTEADASSQLQTLFQAQIASTTVAYASGEYTVTFPSATEVLWSESSLNLIYNGAKNDASASTTLVFGGEEVSPTPDFMELHSSDVASGTLSNRATSGDIIFPRQAMFSYDGYISFTTTTNIQVELRRTNCSTACPTTLPWDIILSK